MNIKRFNEYSRIINEEWAELLHGLYESIDEFEAQSRSYGLAKRLGYADAKSAWADNPIIVGGIDPKKYRRVNGDVTEDSIAESGVLSRATDDELYAIWTGRVSMQRLAEEEMRSRALLDIAKKRESEKIKDVNENS